MCCKFFRKVSLPFHLWMKNYNYNSNLAYILSRAYVLCMCAVPDTLSSFQRQRHKMNEKDVPTHEILQTPKEYLWMAESSKKGGKPKFQNLKLISAI